MNNIIKYLPLLALLILFSCKSRKKFAAPNTVVKSKDSLIINNVNLAENLIQPTLKSWTYFSAKADLEYTSNGNSQGVGSNIRMYKDSLIWISVNVFGIEGARILINKDSMVLLDKLHKCYTVFNKNYIENLLGSPLSVSQLQNLIVAEPIYALMLYKIIKNTESELLILNTQPKVTVGHTYKKEFYTIDSTSIDDLTAPHYARVKYSNFANVDNHNFPLKNLIIAYNGQNKITITMDFDNPNFSEIVTFPFNIPTSYEKCK
ncbi:MAG: DUF4292 domain-containing protein [bacterium]|nr:DUF4292 domain-containing protein [bacterium]